MIENGLSENVLVRNHVLEIHAQKFIITENNYIDKHKVCDNKQFEISISSNK